MSLESLLDEVVADLQDANQRSPSGQNEPVVSAQPASMKSDSVPCSLREFALHNYSIMYLPLVNECCRCFCQAPMYISRCRRMTNSRAILPVPQTIQAMSGQRQFQMSSHMILGILLLLRVSVLSKMWLRVHLHPAVADRRMPTNRMMWTWTPCWTGSWTR